MVAVNMVAESWEDSIVGRNVNVPIDNAFYLTFDIYQIKEPPFGTELKDDTNTRMFNGFIIRKGREETRFPNVILPKDRQYLSFKELVCRRCIWLSHDAKIPLFAANNGNFLILASGRLGNTT